MPAQADITVLNAAGGNVTYVKNYPANGPGSWASWRVNAASSIIALRPEFMSRVTTNPAQTVDRLTFRFRGPVEDPNILGQVKYFMPIETNLTLPRGADSAALKDYFVQYGNLLVAALIRSVVEDASNAS